MKFVNVKDSGKNSILEFAERIAPKPKAKEIQIQVFAAGINRADLLQRRGFYPPPEGASDILGLECAGVVSETGPSMTRWKVGDRVCGLMAGGGYAQFATVHEDHCFPIHENLTFEEAAALPETVMTCYLNLIQLGQMSAGESVMIFSAASGIGTMAIQMAKWRGANVMAIAGQDEKLDQCLKLGADTIINYKTRDVFDIVKSAGGADITLDTIGGASFQKLIPAMKFRGRIILIGLLGGSKSEIDLDEILSKNLTMMGSTLRNRNVVEKAELAALVRSEVWPAIESGRIKPIVDSIRPWDEAEEAHQKMAKNENFGKMILKIS